MKKLSVLLLTVFVLAIVITSCNSPPPATGWEAVAGKEWRLIEVNISDQFNRHVLFSRKELTDDNHRNVFTITFAGDNNLAGVAAPNRYNAPFSLGEAQSISIMPARATQMAAIFQPERLREHDYFTFLHNVYKWDLKDGKLVLNSKAEDERDVAMIFE